MHNGNIVVNTPYGKVVYMLYGICFPPIQHIDSLYICCMYTNLMSIKHIEKLSICCFKKMVLIIQRMENLFIYCMGEAFFFI